MSRKRRLKSPERRDFFKKVGLGAGAAGAVAMGLTSGSAKAGAPVDRGFKKGLYRETEHVRRYYELARF